MSAQQLLARLVDELPAPERVEPFAFLEDERLPPRIALVEPTAFVLGWASELIERDSHALAAAARIRRNVTDARQNVARSQATARDRGLSEELSSGGDQL